MSRTTRSELPGWAVGLVERMAPDAWRDAVVGDFVESFAARSSDSVGGAWMWFWLQLVRSIPSFFSFGFYFEGGMLKNYLVVSRRNLTKRKFFSALNIGGLAIGMAACLLIFQYVVFEYSFDDYHEDVDQIYRINFGAMEGDQPSLTEMSVSALGPLFAEQLPGLERFARVHPNYGDVTLSYERAGGDREAVHVDGAAFVDPAYLDIFTVPFVEGTPTGSLDQPKSILISESAAARHFAEGDALGREIDVHSWSTGAYTITGVFRDIPSNSHLRLDYIMPLRDLLEQESGQYAESDGWSWTNFMTYARLHPDADAASLSATAADLVNEHRREAVNRSGDPFVVQFQPLKDIHLYTNFTGEYDGWSNGSRRTVYFFTIVALFILAIAWINYINLTTARAIERAKEVGVRKAVGARKGQVVSQFIFESALVNVIALVLAVALAILALPQLNELVGASIELSVWGNPGLLGTFLLVFGLGAVLASLYPAFVLSAYRPATVLKGGSSSGRGHDRLRKVLVVFQFSASVALLIGTYVVYSQVEFIRAYDPGMDLDEVMVIKRPRVFSDDQDRQAQAKLRDRFVQEVSTHSSVNSIALSSTVPGGNYSLGTTFSRAGAPPSEAEEVNVTWISHDFPETYGLKLIAGRSFSREFETDREEAVVVNETAVRMLGFATAEEAIGRRVQFGPEDDEQIFIVGVFEDFNWMSAKQAVPPVVFALTGGGSHFSVKVATANLDETIGFIQGKFRELYPGNPFDYFFADGYFDQQHRADQRFSALFGLFAAFALVVACLGLIGLAAYTASQRTKEIGIRKVHGARSSDIVRLMLSDTARLIVAAVLISTPLVWLVLNEWLSDFPVRIGLTPLVFLVPVASALLVALLTVAYHTTRAAVMDPVESLRYE